MQLSSRDAPGWAPFFKPRQTVKWVHVLSAAAPGSKKTAVSCSTSRTFLVRYPSPQNASLARQLALAGAPHAPGGRTLGLAVGGPPLRPRCPFFPPPTSPPETRHNISTLGSVSTLHHVFIPSPVTFPTICHSFDQESIQANNVPVIPFHTTRPNLSFRASNPRFQPTRSSSDHSLSLSRGPSSFKSLAASIFKTSTAPFKGQVLFAQSR